MKFRLLGPLEVEGDHGVVSLGSGKQRALLSILLLRANESVSREGLIDGLWGDEPPASAGHSVEVYVSRLRKTLVEAGGDAALTTRGSGYQLRVAPGESDASRFRQLLEEAHGAEPRRASTLLSEGLALWRGRALSDVHLEGAARASVDGLEELRLVALEERIEADLALGRHRQLVGELQPLVSDHPLRERLRSQQMRALYGSGRQAEALDSYGGAQQALSELGLEPAPELKRLQRQILNHDPGLGPPNAQSPVSPGRRRPRRRRLTVFAIPLAAAVAAALAIGLTRDSHATPVRVVGTTNSVGLFDTKRRRLVADIPSGSLSTASHSGSGPCIAVGFGYVWACNAIDRTVLRVDPRTRSVTRTIGLGASPGALAVGHGFVWVEPVSGTELLKLDSDGNLIQRIALRPPPKPFRPTPGPVSVAAGRDAIWAVHGLASVAKIDPSSGRVLRDTIGFGGALVGEIVPTRTAVWAPAVSAGRVLRLDPETDTLVEETEPAGGGLASWTAVAAGAGGIWVADQQGGTGVVSKVWLVDPTTDLVEGSVSVDSYPRGLVVRDGKVWVVCSLAGTIDEIDPATLSVISRRSLGGHPLDVANGPDGLWIAFGDLVP
jgi:DNA-binding SARP family transcriptional activator/DNA-binding beta-propeller fold protein YncE